MTSRRPRLIAAGVLALTSAASTQDAAYLTTSRGRRSRTSAATSRAIVFCSATEVYGRAAGSHCTSAARSISSAVFSSTA